MKNKLIGILQTILIIGSIIFVLLVSMKFIFSSTEDEKYDVWTVDDCVEAKSKYKDINCVELSIALHKNQTKNAKFHNAAEEALKCEKVCKGQSINKEEK